MSAGFTPDIREACPRVPGFIVNNFSAVMAKKDHVHVLGQLKHFNLGNDLDNDKNENEFINKYLQYRGETYPKKAMHPI